ncbi:ATP-binding protein [Cellulomonas humilata]|uniref:ATP-binding protein n=1 Tax=Cellulomonas humilata TaxID=144055 RepID=A0A7Y6A6K0_9CELL|nr:ATP-binding protein [Cellulomonas humilata]NUU19607.1 ATP-binding protein [Cellulomonas humilata]
MTAQATRGTVPAAAAGTFATLAEAVSLQALADVGTVTVAPTTFAPVWDHVRGSSPSGALRRLCDGFDLTPPEQALVALLFSAGSSEAVARAAADAVASAGGVAGDGLPLWLAVRAIPGLGPEALATDRPLVRFDMVCVDLRGPRIESRLVLDLAVLDRLLGHSARDPLVVAHMHEVPVPAGPRTADRLSLALAGALASAETRPGLPPLVLVPGSTAGEVAEALHALGLPPWRIAAADVPDDAGERARLAARWTRDAALDGAALVLDAAATDSDGRLAAATTAFVDRVVGHVVMTGDRVPSGLCRALRVVPQAPDDPVAARARWTAALGPARAARVGRGLGRVSGQFRLGPEAVRTAVACAAGGIDVAPDEPSATASLWHAAARAVDPAPLPGVSILEAAYDWDDIVLPAATEATLRRVELHVRHASQVFDDWGFAERTGGRGSWRGRGVAVLFAGPSGTGKTMAAEVLASSLDLRVMAIDLSQIISKWVGETSKNIAAAFEEAERSGAIMVWNEGDAVWGVRGGVGNATDRHVNAEVGDLLQRIESFSGFTVVTTNLRHAIDPAFLRRFRFVVDFPLPSRDERARLWRSAFPPATPTEPVDVDALAALPLTGGSIRNVALGAAFLAAGTGGPVDRSMLEAELAEELRKQNLPMPHVAWGDR